MASYLHAVPCQELTALNFRLDAIRRRLDGATPAQTARAIQDLQAITSQCTHSLRWFIEWLRYDGVFGMPFADMLAAAAGMAQLSTRTVRVTCELNDQELSPALRERLVVFAGSAAMELRAFGLQQAALVVRSDGAAIQLRCDEMDGHMDASADTPAGIESALRGQIAAQGETLTVTADGHYSLSILNT